MAYLDDIDDVELMKPILSMCLPSRILLFKIMRATVGCKTKEDLWMYIDDYRNDDQCVINSADEEEYTK
jgi:hypothetical protein